MFKLYHVYILSNWNKKVLYVGVTDNIKRRIWEHKTMLRPGFTARYNVNRLVYMEAFQDGTAASVREKQLKGWLRLKKTQLIESHNPAWHDLSEPWYKGSLAFLDAPMNRIKDPSGLQPSG